MGQAAMSLSEGAIKEGKRCFDAPLDMTVQNVKAPPGSREVRDRPEAPFYSLGLGSGLEGVPASNGASAGQGYANCSEQGAHSHMPAPSPMATQSSLPSSRGAGFHHGHPEDTGGYFEEPLSVGDLTSLQETFTNHKFDGPPPVPPRPITGATTRPMSAIQAPPISSAPPQQESPSRRIAPEGPVAVAEMTRPMPVYQATALPEATTAALPTAAPAAPAPMHVQTTNEETQRNLWRQGSILEIYSGSTGRWYPSLLLRLQPGQGTPDVVTTQFWINAEDAKQKSLYRNDQQLAPLGTNLKGELPPGFCVKPSQSRPGQSVFQDLSTGMKYQTVELAWQTHFQRLLERPAASGQETVAYLPSNQSMIQQQGHVPQEQGQAAAAGLTTEYGGGEAGPASSAHAASRDNQALMTAEGVSTEYCPYAAHRKVPTPCQATSAEQRWEAHGAQLAAEVAGVRLHPGGQSARLHQYNTQPEVMACR